MEPGHGTMVDTGAERDGMQGGCWQGLGPVGKPPGGAGVQKGLLSWGVTHAELARTHRGCSCF